MFSAQDRVWYIVVVVWWTVGGNGDDMAMFQVSGRVNLGETEFGVCVACKHTGVPRHTYCLWHGVAGSSPCPMFAVQRRMFSRGLCINGVAWVPVFALCHRRTLATPEVVGDRNLSKSHAQVCRAVTLWTRGETMQRWYTHFTWTVHRLVTQQNEP